MDFLQKTLLFRGMDPQETADALRLLSARECSYPKGAVLLHAGTACAPLGLVLTGSVTIESNDLWGTRTILSHVSAGQCFAETYALLPDEPLLVDVTANESCRVLFLDMGQLRFFTVSNASWAIHLMSNLLLVSVRKNLHLSGRSFHISQKSIRGRVMSYLNSVSLQKGSRQFDIPFDRQQLSDYLNLERTALSKELGRMQKEGFIRFRKNHFTLLCTDPDLFTR